MIDTLFGQEEKVGWEGVSVLAARWGRLPVSESRWSAINQAWPENIRWVSRNARGQLKGKNGDIPFKKKCRDGLAKPTGGKLLRGGLVRSHRGGLIKNCGREGKRLAWAEACMGISTDQKSPLRKNDITGEVSHLNKS